MLVYVGMFYKATRKLSNLTPLPVLLLLVSDFVWLFLSFFLSFPCGDQLFSHSPLTDILIDSC